MNKFSQSRFGRYAKFDLTINRSFYRNLALVLFATIVGVVILFFLVRWLLYSIGTSTDTYNDITTTAIFTVSIINIALYIMAGCTLHPLRNKQGRITHFTLPATNLEKYLWHVLVCIGGCVVVAVLSVAIADLLNWLLSLWVFKSADGVQSLFATAFYGIPDRLIGQMNTTFISMSGMNPADYDPTYVQQTDPTLSSIIYSGWTLGLCTVLFEMSLYALGNALKYKYNIIITYVVTQFASFLLAICLLVGIIVFGNNADSTDLGNMEYFIRHLDVFIYILAALITVAGIAIWVWAYKLYTRAQLTNAWNK